MSMTVLLVEDNPMNRELAQDLLELEGFRVEVAVSGEEVRARLAGGEEFAVILMDILLPDADGVTLLGEVRRSRLAAVPVIAVTAQALGGDRERFLAAGFDAVITKPIDTRRFVSDIRRILTARAAASED